MGLFDKKYCSICGDKIGLLGNRKLEDGNLCKHCAAKLSPFFSERRHSTVDGIKEQLAYREQFYNKAKHKLDVTLMDNYEKIKITIEKLKELLSLAPKQTT